MEAAYFEKGFIMVGKKVCVCHAKEFTRPEYWMQTGTVHSQGVHVGPGVVWNVKFDNGKMGVVPSFCLRVASEEPVVAAAEN